MKAAALASLLLISAPSAARAQEMDHSHMNHGSAMREEGIGQDPAASPLSPAKANPHAHHAPHAASEDVPQGTAPELPSDHAADAIYDPADMARARTAMLNESGGMTFSQVMFDRIEYRAAQGADGYHWQGEGWIGGDMNRLAFKTEGEGIIGGRPEHAEAQALYRRAIDPWFNLEAGVRHDFGTDHDRTYTVVGIEGLAPYWFEVGAQFFLSHKGDAHLRLEASYDQRITQRLILQPAAEVNIAAQDVSELGVGSGLADVELGLRLRYEIAREFAPYVGINWERKLGDSARFARADGERPSTTSMVIGVRFWF